LVSFGLGDQINFEVGGFEDIEGVEGFRYEEACFFAFEVERGVG